MALTDSALKARVHKVELLGGEYVVANSAVHDFTVAAVVDFQHETHVPGADNNFGPNTWFIPETSGQRDFHFVQLLQRTDAAGTVYNALRFLVVTGAPASELKVHGMRVFADLFNHGRHSASVPPPVHNFEVAIITTAAHALNYKSNPPIEVIGNVADFWQEDQLQIYAFTRFHEM